MDAISRDYSTLSSNAGIWGLGVLGRPSSETLGTIKGLQEKFEQRGDTENMGDTLISDHKLSPMMAFSIAEPVYKQRDVNEYVKSLPKLERIETIAETVIPKQREKTLEIAPQLMKLMGQKASPLAIGYELQKKGYDPEVWRKYLLDHRKEWNPTESQGRQVEKLQPFLGKLNDWWLSSFSGIK
jgi:hypothetical protein